MKKKRNDISLVVQFVFVAILVISLFRGWFSFEEWGFLGGILTGLFSVFYAFLIAFLFHILFGGFLNGD